MLTIRNTCAWWLAFLGLAAHAQQIKTADGQSLGSRSDFITSCVNGVPKNSVQLKGITFNKYDYCACVCDKLIPTLYYDDIEKALENDELTDLFLADGNFEIIMSCATANAEISDNHTFEKSGDPEILEIQLRAAKKSCLMEIRKDSVTFKMLTEEAAEKYCDCALDKLYENGYTYKEIQDIENVNSSAFNEIALPCMIDALRETPAETTPRNTYIPEDISGRPAKSEVALMNYLDKGYKIKIDIGGKAQYFLFDTGASDLIINDKTELELLRSGAIKPEDYLGKADYRLANNKLVKAQLVRVDGITIGDYTVNNTVIAIIEDGSLLCGKSMLDKFKKWELDAGKGVLTLYK